jgi:anaerobic selenocysteine-containing dehydrogenase
LLHSLKRDFPGTFAEITTATAMDEIVAKLDALIAEHGPRSVAFYRGAGAYRSVLGALLERAFVAAIGSPNFSHRSCMVSS